MSGRSYKKTLNLPGSGFAMRANLAKREPDTMARWTASKLYQRMVERRTAQQAPTFTFHDGPPYANGTIHIGHILNKILKDIVVKYRLMSGYQTSFVPGWDCHGLPIELNVEKTLGSKARDMSDVELRQACRTYAQGFVEQQREDFRRLLVLADWDEPYLTMDPNYEADTVRALGRLIEGGYISRGLKPVFWSWAAHTALALAEVEYQEHVSPSIYVKFPLPSPPRALMEAAGERPVSVVIWTTTPWTLPANVAISLKPDATYVLLGTSAGDALVVAEALVERVVDVCKLGDVQVLTAFEAPLLEGAKARHPWIDRDSVLLLGDHVTLDTGTGAVHTAPGHGVDDFIIGQAHGLDVLSPVDDYGRYTDEVQDYAGLNVFKANPLIVERLHQSGALLSPPDLTLRHTYPYDWRTRKPLIFRATPQWFLTIDHADLRTRSLDAIRDVTWYPSWGEERIHNMIAGRPDWCISRQRRWGVPIPILHCGECGEALLDGRVADKLAAMAETHTCDVWWSEDAETFKPEGVACASCGNTGTFTKETDIVDVWIDSGVSYAAVSEARLGAEDGTADLYLEGSDQHRGWFHSSLLCAMATHGHAPYRSVLTHGFVLDEEGNKYSKSSRNYVAPSKIINQYGAEVLRLWVASENVRSDLPFSGAIVKQVSDAYRKIRNTWKFMLGAVEDYTPGVDDVAFDQLEALDHWALVRAEGWLQEVLDAYERYDFTALFRATMRLVTSDLSAFYLDVIKDRLYASAPDWPTRRAAQTVVYRILEVMLRALAPVLSFTADEAWQVLPKPEGVSDEVFLTDMPKDLGDIPLDEGARSTLLSTWGTLREVRGVVQQQIEPLRRDKVLGNRQQAAVTLVAEGETAALLKAHEAILADVLMVSRVVLEHGTPAEGAMVEARVQPTDWKKCPRCWNFREDIGADAAYSDVCGRCAKALHEIDAAADA